MKAKTTPKTLVPKGEYTVKLETVKLITRPPFREGDEETEGFNFTFIIQELDELKTSYVPKTQVIGGIKVPCKLYIQTGCYYGNKQAAFTKLLPKLVNLPTLTHAEAIAIELDSLAGYYYKAYVTRETANSGEEYNKIADIEYLYDAAGVENLLTGVIADPFA